MARRAWALWLPALLAGCVERTIYVRSDPPGAVVYLDDERAGVTPCEIPFLWYGKREIVLELQKYRMVREIVTLNPPWWQYFPLDFITDVLVPFTIRDRTELSYVLEPAAPTAQEREEMRARAQELRRKAGVSR
ncbi:MAG: PEGA domain-containing protein [Planctomycetota bacterium]